MSDDTDIVKISYLDINRIKTDRTIILVGKRGTGKSVLMKDLAYQLRHAFDFGIACAPNKDTVDVFKEFVPDTYIYPDFTPDIIDQIIENIKKLQEYNHRPRIFILADDCMKDKKVFKHPAIAELANNGRHYSICLIICVQYLMDVPPNFRMNADYVFALADNDPGTREKLFKEFFGIFGSKEYFGAAFDEFTRDRACIFVDRTLGGASLEQSVCWYRATFELPPFKLGCRDYWKLHYMYRKKDTGKPKLDGLDSLNKKLKPTESEKKQNEEEERLEQIRQKQNKTKKKGHVPVFIRDEPATALVTDKQINEPVQTVDLNNEHATGADNGQTVDKDNRQIIMDNMIQSALTHGSSMNVSTIQNPLTQRTPTRVTPQTRITPQTRVTPQTKITPQTRNEQNEDNSEPLDTRFIHAFSNPVKADKKPTKKRSAPSSLDKLQPKRKKTKTSQEAPKAMSFNVMDDSASDFTLAPKF
jgi:hypothetical protein